MNKIIFFALVLFCVHAVAQRQMERLDRGVVAAKMGSSNNAFVSWRLLGTDPTGVTFNVYRNSETTPINSSPLDAAHTNLTVTGGAAAGTTYSVAVLVNGTEVERSRSAPVWQSVTGNNSAYFDISVQKPYTGAGPQGGTLTIYDGTAADLDGDGQYEIIFFWVPDNMKDNSQDGRTDNVYIDAYKLDGTKMWPGKWINLGPNIRAGAHYQTFLVYDFDGDGKAEIIVKTADGTTDTEGTRIGTTSTYVNSAGHIYGGPEYISVFDGATGKLIDTKDYDPPIHPTKLTPTAAEVRAIWGGPNDGAAYNRPHRYLAAVAYLDGKKPSAVMWRGYYTRTAAAAWDFDGKELKKLWLFDTYGMSGGSVYQDRGNHNLSVAEVDGKDIIISGGVAINADGTPRYQTGTPHGDAMHVSKHIPNRAGLQVFRCLEGSPFGVEMYDASTGTKIWSVEGNKDTGRALCADIDPNYDGNECWGTDIDIYSATGIRLGSQPGNLSNNMAIWWDGDTGRETWDGYNLKYLTKVSASAGSGSNLRTFSRSHLVEYGGSGESIGGTKANSVLQADILGDWREEFIVPASTAHNALRIYTTTMPTVHTGAGAIPSQGIPTLMHNKMYRLAVAWQHTGYNQPPWTDYFLGFNMGQVPRDNIVYASGSSSSGGLASSSSQAPSSSSLAPSSSSRPSSSSSLAQSSSSRQVYSSGSVAWVNIGSGEFIENVQIFDPPNADAWAIETNFRVNAKTYGDRDDYITLSVPEELLGAEWISTSMETRRLTSPATIIQFTMKTAGTIYVLYEDRVDPKPTWLENSGFTETEMTAKVLDNSPDGRDFTVYAKTAELGETVSIGINSNDGTTQSLMYLVAIIGEGTTPILVSGKWQVVSGQVVKYYSLKGVPMGTTKPSIPGVYIEKTGKNFKKIVVR